MDEQTVKTIEWSRRHSKHKTCNLKYNRISLWSKTAGKLGFCSCITDGPTEGWTDGPMVRRMDPLIDMCSWWMHLKTRLKISSQMVHKFREKKIGIDRFLTCARTISIHLPVGKSVSQSASYFFGILAFSSHCSCPNALATFSRSLWASEFAQNW